MPKSLPSTPRFVRPVAIWLPTWRLVIPALVLLAVLILGLGARLNGFLSVSRPVAANVLVIEGWSPDYALEWAVREFERGHYDLLIAAGGPMERGALVSGYRTYADIAVATLKRMGVDPSRLVGAPAETTFRNRTYVSAQGVREVLAGNGVEVRGVNIVSLGPHARRSWVVYCKVLGGPESVGILAVPPEDYDPERWWASSPGVKSTIAETLGWLYESLFEGGR